MKRLITHITTIVNFLRNNKIRSFVALAVLLTVSTLCSFLALNNQQITSSETDSEISSIPEISANPWNYSSEFKRLRKYEDSLNNKVKVLDAILNDLEKNEVIQDSERRVDDKNKRAGLKSSYKLGVGGVEFNSSPKKHETQIQDEQVEKNTDNKKSEKVSILINEFEKQIAKISNIPLGSPVSGSLTSEFGWRTSPFKWQTKFHQGIDISVERNTPITATADGIVIEAGYRGGYGNCITIQHKNGYQTVYAHLEKISVSAGEKVCRGTFIGQVGTTGHSTGPHLHYEIIKNDEAVDPWKYVQTAKLIKQIIKKESPNS